MDATRPTIAATQFSAFMGATNGCESWSTYVLGHLVVAYGYAPSIAALAAVSLLALPALTCLRLKDGAETGA